MFKDATGREVQIPTVFEHAFNIISRAWVYKAETSFAPGWLDRFRELSSRLSDLDNLAAGLHNENMQQPIKDGFHRLGEILGRDI